MNILFLSTHLNAGGITSYLLTMAKGLIRRGHRVYVATSGGNREGDFASLGVHLLTLNIRTKSEMDPRIYLALIPLSRYVQKNNIDLIHAQTRITQVMGALLAKITGKPYVSTCHGYFKTRLSRRIIPCWGDAVIAISEAVEKHLRDDFKVAEKKICLIESGVDIEAFVPAEEGRKKECRERFHLGDGLVVGMLARLSDVKGQDILIEAMSKVTAQLRNVKLVLVGEGKTEDALKSKARDLNLNGHVQFFSVEVDRYEALSLFDLFVMPSRQEGLGLSIMEAQSAGLPVIASRVGGIPSLIEDGKTGVLVAPEDPDELAEAMVKLLRDKALMNRIGMAAREFIKAKYSSEVMIEKVVTLYQKIITSPS
ncbi:MAG: glycosyltransferase family 4 protein [Candidatus Omnitrophica bacterium]|nr:glycosyltransferase family 4 protein [Candidatus Omnitrophota bacterium]